MWLHCPSFQVSDFRLLFGFFSNLSNWIARLSLVAHSEARVLGLQRWTGVQSLYGKDVISDALLHCLNGGLGYFSHSLQLVSAAAAPDSSADSAPAEGPHALPAFRDVSDVHRYLLDVLRRRLLQVDEQPTLTRMFTFTTHMQTLLLMHFLDCPRALLQVGSVNIRAKAKQRVNKVLQFFQKNDVGQYLRRSVLTVNVLQHLHSICAQSVDISEPLLVRIARGGIRQVLSADISRVLFRLHLDPDLQVTSFLPVLLSIGIEVCVRFEEYEEWPYRAYTLSRKFNADGYVTACLHFLEMPNESLDTGFGLPLWRFCQRIGDIGHDKLDFLLGASFQACLEQAFESSAASSLAVERRFAQTKRSESARLCHVATASRNQLLRQHWRQRQQLLQQAEHSSAALRRSLKTNLISLAWEYNPHFSTNALSGGVQKQVSHYISTHDTALRAELDRRRSAAKAAVDRCNDSQFPLTQHAWINWFRKHEDDFLRTWPTHSRLGGCLIAD